MPTLLNNNNFQPLPNIKETSIIPIVSDYKVLLSLCTWKDNKKAACTIAFDDTRPSHYQISVFELDRYNFKGTFNLNTKRISNWKAWRYLHNQGHEIGSHTWSHPKCTELNKKELHYELSRAITDILRNIDEI